MTDKYDFKGALEYLQSKAYDPRDMMTAFYDEIQFALREVKQLQDDCIIIEKSDVPEGFMDKFLIMLETQKRVAVLERGLAEQMKGKDYD